ncbi:MAG TPA: metallophosphoesterase family protein [Cytophagales bacterium]|nr:metallophosphoesterase family protein [Cytophagales bacterium]
MSRYAIGDIHGCVKTFKSLVEEGLKLKKEDTLYLLGDLVNKGPDSRGVMDYIFLLKKENYNIISLRGNHDQMFLNAYYGKIAHYWTTEFGGPKTIKSFEVDNVEDIPIQYFDFIKDMPYFLELDNCFLVHAGFNFEVGNPLLDIRAMMHSRKFKLDAEQLGGKRLIHGHVPTPLSEIKYAAEDASPEINLDGGCVYFLNDDLGSLVGMNIDTTELFVKENIDKPYPIDIKN